MNQLFYGHNQSGKKIPLILSAEFISRLDDNKMHYTITVTSPVVISETERTKVFFSIENRDGNGLDLLIGETSFQAGAKTASAVDFLDNTNQAEYTITIHGADTPLGFEYINSPIELTIPATTS